MVHPAHETPPRLLKRNRPGCADQSAALLAFIVSLAVLFTLTTISPLAAALPVPPQPNNPSNEQRDRRINLALGLITSDISVATIHLGAENSMTADVVIRGAFRKLRFVMHSVRAPGHKLLAQVADGGYVEVIPGPSKTYWGSLENDPASTAAGSMTSTGLFATVRFGDGEQYWIEPIAPRVPGEQHGLYVAYRTQDVAECIGHCGTDELANPNPQAPPVPQPPGPAPNPPPLAASSAGGALAGTVGSSCLARLAIDADREYYVKYGSSTTTVNDRVELVINAMNIEYSTEVGITHVLGTVIVRTVEPDPYSATDSGDLMDELQDQWVDHHAGVERDAVQLFTNKNIDGGTIGLGYIGSICDDTFGYSLVQSDSDPNFACSTDLSAHELGHNWNCPHCPCANPPYTMNSYNVCSNHFHPTESIPVITSYRESRSCLECGPLLEFQFNVSGNAASEKLGQSAAIIGDVNNDDVPDVIIGTPENDQGGVNKGKITMVSGATGSVLWARYGYFAGDQLGYSVAACGNTVVAGAPYNDDNGSNAGAVYVYAGATGTLLKKKAGQVAGDRFGWSVSGDVDIDNDSQPDFIVGAPYNDYQASNAGAVYIYKGGTFATLKKLRGQNASDRFGFSVAMIGNCSGDAFGDFIVGAPYHDAAGSNSGCAYIYSGSNYALLYPAINGFRAGDHFGRCVAGVGLVNGDSRHDFAVGAPYYDGTSAANAGRLYVYSGALGTLLFAKSGGVADDQMGTSISTAGDVDRDGRGDVLVGAPRNDQAATNAGQVYLYSGRNQSVLARFRGELAGDLLGGAVAGWTDDDSAWVTFGAALNNGSASDTGRAYVYASPSIDSSFAGPAPVQMPGCPADLAGGDHVVDVNDLLAVLHHWTNCPNPCPPGCREDLNHDCRVDGSDLQLLLSAWGACP